MQVPDVDAVVHFQDVPIADLPQHAASAPVFSYTSNDDFVDVPFPDWTIWGNMAHNQPASWQVSMSTHHQHALSAQRAVVDALPCIEVARAID